LTQEGLIEADLTRAWDVARKCEERAPLLGKELEAARRRLAELEAEAERNFYEQANPGHMTHRLNEHRERNPLLFLAADVLAERMVEAEVNR
jgi:hypothetical protein